MLLCICIDLFFLIILTLKSFVELISKNNSDKEKNKSKSQSIIESNNSRLLLQDGKEDPQKHIEENKIEEKNEKSNIVSSSSNMLKTKRGRQESKKNKASTLSSLQYKSNMNKNAEIIEEVKEKPFIGMNPHNQNTGINRLNPRNLNYPSFKMGQTPLFRINEEEKEEENGNNVPNDLNQDFTKRDEEIKKMTIEEPELDNDIENNSLPRWMLERFPILHYLLKFPKKAEKSTIDTISKGGSKISGIENNQISNIGRPIEISERKEVPQSSFKGQSNNREGNQNSSLIEQNPIYTDDNLYKRYLDEHVSRLTGGEYNTGVLNRGQVRRTNEEEEKIHNLIHKITNPISLTRGIAPIMKASFFGNPITNQFKEDSYLNRNTEKHENQNQSYNPSSFQRATNTPKKMYENNEGKISKEANLQIHQNFQLHH